MGSDIIRLLCPNLKCRALLSVPAAARGKAVRCRQCGTRIRVPDQARPKAPTTDQPEPATQDAPAATTD